MSIIALPSALRLRHFELELDRPAQANVSAYTGARKVVANPWHGKWRAKVDFAFIQGEASFRPWRAFFALLKGQVNTFQLLTTEGAQHGGSNPTLTSNAAQGATTAVLTGAAALTAGMYATFPLPSGNKQMVMLTLDISGSTITFEPPLREAVASSTTIETMNPYVLVALADSRVRYTLDPARLYNVSLDLEEAF